MTHDTGASDEQPWPIVFERIMREPWLYAAFEFGRRYERERGAGVPSPKPVQPTDSGEAS